MIYDLHTHSTASDGLLSVEDLLHLASDTGLGGIALTDHDTLNGLAPARSYLERTASPLLFIPGIELNTEDGEESIHVLGYGIRENHAALIGRLQEIHRLRRQRIAKMVERLQSLGLRITMEEVETNAQGGQLGRPHLAMALIRRGYVRSQAQAFNTYLERGRPAYVPRYEFKPQEAIALIKEAEGIPVLAHPGLIRRQQRLGEIIAMGFLGLECEYPQHSRQQTRYYRIWAQEHDLIITGGSDFHGAGSGNQRDCLGKAGLNDEEMKYFIGKLRF